MRVSPRSRTVMYSLHSLEDCCEVIDQLIANNTVVLTMDELDGRLLQRAVDTLSGAVFALHASIRKASDKTYLVAPMSVEVNEAYLFLGGFGTGLTPYRVAPGTGGTRTGREVTACWDCTRCFTRATCSCG